MLANLNRGRGDEPFTAGDFLPMTKAERDEHEAAKVRESQRALAAALRATKGGAE